MKTSIVAAAALMAVTGVAASAQDAQEEGSEEKKICRTSKMTGSLTRRSRICLTEAQWRELEDRTRTGVNDLQGSASGAQSCNPGAPGAVCR